MGRKEFEFTCEEGQALVRLTTIFALPEKLGDQTYTPIERALAAEEVRALYRELRSHSPLMTRDKLTLFGPEDNYKTVKDENGAPAYRITTPSRTVKIRMSDESESGLMWLLISALHPDSAGIQSVAVQNDLFWPLVERARRARAVREALGLDKAKPRRWESDDDEAPEKSKDETKKLEKSS